MSSRELSIIERVRAKTKGLELREITIAYDGIAVVVNEKKLCRRPVAATGGGGIRGRHRGLERGRWRTGPDIGLHPKRLVGHVFGLPRGSRCASATTPRARRRWPGNQQVADEVAHNPNGIGYVGMPYARALG